jgi:hypothetical protein
MGKKWFPNGFRKLSLQDSSSGRSSSITPSIVISGTSIHIIMISFIGDGFVVDK